MSKAPLSETPVTETPVTETPVTENPVTENPATETPVAEAPIAGAQRSAPLVGHALSVDRGLAAREATTSAATDRATKGPSFAFQSSDHPNHAGPDAATARRVLVAGVGNIFLGDDGFGVEVANRLAQEEWPAGVTVADFGIRGVHLAYELLNNYDALILVDAFAAGEDPGTISVLDPTLTSHREPEEQGIGPDSAENDVEGVASVSAVEIDAHSLHPAAVLSLLHDLGGTVEEILLVGCEPEELEEGIGLSAVVTRAVEEAITVVRELAEEASLGPRGKESP